MIVILSSIQSRRVTAQYHNDPDVNIEVSAIVTEFGQRMKKLEENLVDQKVKLEILELRAQRASSASTPGSGVMKGYEGFAPLRQEQSEIRVTPQQIASAQLEDKSPIITPQIRTAIDQKINVLNRRPGGTEREALRMVFEGRGNTTAKDIQQRIGRTREHTARMMNSLFQEGLVERDITARPFAYSITQKGREFLNS